MSDAVEHTAKALDEQRTKNPEFRDYLVNEVAVSTFAALDSDSLQQFRRSLDLLLDGALELGADSGLLAYRGGLGHGSSSESIEAWSALDVDRLRKLFGVGEQDAVQCTASLPDGNGVVSTDGKHVALFEGAALALNIAVKIGADHFVSGGFPDSMQATPARRSASRSATRRSSSRPSPYRRTSYPALRAGSAWWSSSFNFGRS